MQIMLFVDMIECCQYANSQEVDQYSKGIDCIISLSALLQLLSVIFSH